MILSNDMNCNKNIFVPVLVPVSQLKIYKTSTNILQAFRLCFCLVYHLFTSVMASTDASMNEAASSTDAAMNSISGMSAADDEQSALEKLRRYNMKVANMRNTFFCIFFFCY